jgi:hypothetical protein
MTRSDRIAVLLSYWPTAIGHDRILERMAHTEDEMAYVWQAQLSLRSPDRGFSRSPKVF